MDMFMNGLSVSKKDNPDDDGYKSHEQWTKGCGEVIFTNTAPVIGLSLTASISLVSQDWLIYHS